MPAAGQFQFSTTWLLSWTEWQDLAQEKGQLEIALLLSGHTMYPSHHEQPGRTASNRRPSHKGRRYKFPYPPKASPYLYPGPLKHPRSCSSGLGAVVQRGWMGWSWCGPDASPFLLLDEGDTLLWNKNRSQLVKRCWQLLINVNYNGQWIIWINFTFKMWDFTAGFSGECEGFLFHFNCWDVLALCHLYDVLSRTKRLLKTRAGICRNQSSVQRFVKEILGLVWMKICLCKHQKK